MSERVSRDDIWAAIIIFIVFTATVDLRGPVETARLDELSCVSRSDAVGKSEGRCDRYQINGEINVSLARAANQCGWRYSAGDKTSDIYSRGTELIYFDSDNWKCGLIRQDEFGFTITESFTSKDGEMIHEFESTLSSGPAMKSAKTVTRSDGIKGRAVHYWREFREYIH